MSNIRSGRRNKRADAFPRKDWSRSRRDSDLDPKTGNVKSFLRLSCKECGSKHFEVLSTDAYETTARCPCGRYYVVHTG